MKCKVDTAILDGGNYMRAFMSYQTADREIAGRVAALLTGFECTAFMAHENIEVSGEWRLEILDELMARTFSSLFLAPTITIQFGANRSRVSRRFVG